MTSHKVLYNSSRSRFEAACPDGHLDTEFVFPPELKEGDELPDLFLLDVQSREPFRIAGHYDKQTDSLQFVLRGPSGFFYKMSVQLDSAGKDEPYIFKFKQHGETHGGDGIYEHNILCVPKSICLDSSNLIEASPDILKHWAFVAKVCPKYFCKLRLKVRVERGSFDEPPVHLVTSEGDRKSIHDLMARNEPKLRNDEATVKKTNPPPMQNAEERKPTEIEGEQPDKQEQRVAKDKPLDQHQLLDWVMPAFVLQTSKGKPQSPKKPTMTTSGKMTRDEDHRAISAVYNNKVQAGKDFGGNDEEQTVIVDRAMEVILVQAGNNAEEKCTRIGQRMHVANPAIPEKASSYDEKSSDQSPASEASSTERKDQQSPSHLKSANESKAISLENDKDYVITSKRPCKVDSPTSKCHYNVPIEALKKCVLDESSKEDGQSIDGEKHQTRLPSCKLDPNHTAGNDDKNDGTQSQALISEASDSTSGDSADLAATGGEPEQAEQQKGQIRLHYNVPKEALKKCILDKSSKEDGQSIDGEKHQTRLPSCKLDPNHTAGNDDKNDDKNDGTQSQALISEASDSTSGDSADLAATGVEPEQAEQQKGRIRLHYNVPLRKIQKCVLDESSKEDKSGVTRESTSDDSETGDSSPESSADESQDEEETGVSEKEESNHEAAGLKVLELYVTAPSESVRKVDSPRKEEKKKKKRFWKMPFFNRKRKS